jgi:hypothetical protein
MLEFEVGKINGTVGWEVICQLKWEIDFNNRKVTLAAPTHEDVIRNMVCDFFPMVTVSVNNKQMTLCLDTGANTTRLGAVLSGYFSEYEESTMETLAAGSERKERVHVIPEVHFSVGEGAVKLSKVDLAVDNECTKSKFFITPGIIGSDIAMNSIMTIDWFNRHFSIK